MPQPFNNAVIGVYEGLPGYWVLVRNKRRYLHAVIAEYVNIRKGITVLKRFKGCPLLQPGD